MKQYLNFADQRYGQTCIYCHENIETREHTPPRVFLDEPFPGNLPVVGACKKCNNGFSLDEEYTACLIACVICGSTDPQKIGREKIKRILIDKPALQNKLAQAIFEDNGVTCFAVEETRVRKVVRKIASCHILYELNLEVDAFDDNTCSDIVKPISTMTEEDWQAFINIDSSDICIWPEVGSIAMQRLIEDDPSFQNGWNVVQPGRYRYCVIQDLSIIEVRMVFSEYLACIVRCSE